jgi:hypothetical protein
MGWGDSSEEIIGFWEEAHPFFEKGVLFSCI